MPSRHRVRARAERGFTLIELMIVILIIGILAAIAIPLFLGSANKADDADAKSLARNLAIAVDSCNTPAEDFRACDTQAELDAEDVLAGIPYGTAPGEAHVVSATKTSYVVEAISKTQTNGQNDTFTITASVNGQNDHTCTAGSSGTGAGCKNGTW